MSFFSRKSDKEKNQYKIFPMQPKNVEAVLAIIEEHDEDDAETAAIEYERQGLENQYVLRDNQTVVGVTGFRAAENTQGSAWLSWTYLDENIQGQNHGSKFVKEIIDICKNKGYRKLFVSTSDYVDEEDGDIYAKARRFYKSLGFISELTIENYFDEGESKLIYSLELDSNQTSTGPSWSESSNLICVDTFEILECDDTFTFGFDIHEGAMSSEEKDIKVMIERAKSQGAERICVGLPSDASVIQRTLIQCGFTNIGQLKDYYQHGISETNLMLTL